MKAYLFLPLLLVTMLSVSCTKTTNEYVVPNQTILFDLGADQWSFDANTNSYFAPISIPEIDVDVRDIDGVLVYISNPDGTVYEAIPNVYNDISYTYVYEEGQLTLEAQGVGSVGAGNPPRLLVKVVIVRSDF
ncbi:hypothetical protein COR50_11450 [Chitinophaga caeni]|uniref:Uncharacterized protein n=1 Tax=Chitinophaga caeni TaxID=2029983 RepID=A0A291QUM0_9BACT|nr:hypothetical protein [Chitinophaga caeni]ATL47729.1 hypothetical protein COR50_11450 [Chitinophaga caeni]